MMEGEYVRAGQTTPFLDCDAKRLAGGKGVISPLSGEMKRRGDLRSGGWLGRETLPQQVGHCFRC